MKAADLKTYHQKLAKLRARLTGEVLHLSEEAFRADSASGQPNHLAELGSDAYEQDVTLRRLETENDALGEIDAALDRINAGTYGRCERCEKVIPKLRLNAIPYTKHCVNCAREIEMEE